MNTLSSIPKKSSIRVHLGDDGVWWTDSPDIPGCYSQGTTQEVAILNMKDAIFTHFEVPSRLADPSLLSVEGKLRLQVATA